MKRILKWGFVGIVAVAALLQLTNPSRTNPPVVSGHELFPPGHAQPPVATTMRAACYDCHSNETKWPWYSHVAPVSWLVASDVKAGRARMNFSDWPTDHPDRAAKRLGDISEEVQNGEMPPGNYKSMHPEARLTQAQRDQIIQWADEAAKQLRDVPAGAAR